jgi:hypothetical protein
MVEQQLEQRCPVSDAIVGWRFQDKIKLVNNEEKIQTSFAVDSGYAIQLSFCVSGVSETLDF